LWQKCRLITQKKIFVLEKIIIIAFTEPIWTYLIKSLNDLNR
jgi:hypothetical protein